MEQQSNRHQQEWRRDSIVAGIPSQINVIDGEGWDINIYQRQKTVHNEDELSKKTEKKWKISLKLNI